jgi:hypothetical protein
VLEVTRDHGGPGVTVIRFTTDVPTTARVTAAGGPGNASGIAESDDTLAEHHTISLRAGPVSAYNITVTSATGQQGSATIQTELLESDAYFETGTGAPKLSWLPERHGFVTWAFQWETRPQPQFPGSVRVYRKPVGCTTAQACVPEFVPAASAATDFGSSGSLARAGVVFLDRSANFMVIIGALAAPGSEASVGVFYQFDVSQGAVPK